jgi:uncharacterized membrane protein YgcG
MSTTTHNFHVNLDHLAALRRALGELETTLGTAHAHHWPTIDPTLHLGPAAWRVEKGDSATYVYGLLNEANPLGDTHADLVRRLEDWYHRIHEMVTTMTTNADRTHARYSAADDAVAAAAAQALRAVEGDECGDRRGGGRGGGGIRSGGDSASSGSGRATGNSGANGRDRMGAGPQ